MTLIKNSKMLSRTWAFGLLMALLLNTAQAFAKPDCEASLKDVVLGSSMHGAEYVQDIKFTGKKFYNKANNIVICQYQGRRYRASVHEPRKDLGNYRIDKAYVDGKYADNPQLGWNVRLFAYNKKGEKHFKCSGSAISPYWIITAKHCFDDTAKEGYKDYHFVGNVTSDNGKNPEISNVSSIKNTNIDLVLVSLSKPMVLRNYLLLGGASLYDAEGKTVDVYGWGCTRSNCIKRIPGSDPRCTNCSTHIPHISNPDLNHRVAYFKDAKNGKAGLYSISDSTKSFQSGDSGAACSYRGSVLGVISGNLSFDLMNVQCAMMDIDMMNWARKTISIN